MKRDKLIQDKIVLQGLEFHAFHGVFEEEQRLGARFVIDVELYLDLPGEDDLEQSVDYAAVYALIQSHVTQKRYDLIEVLANKLATDLLAAQPKLDGVLVRVHKPHAPLPGVFKDIYAEITRYR